MAINVQTIDAAPTGRPNTSAFKVAVDDGTVPGTIDVLVVTTNATPFDLVEGWQEWIAGQLQMLVSTVIAVDQLAELRRLGPITLRY